MNVILYDLDSSDPKDAPNDDLVRWWHDVWLHKIGGDKFFGNSIKHYKICTQSITGIVGRSTRVTMMAVPASTEAFGAATYYSCRTKWKAIWDYKKEHGRNAKIPKGKNAPKNFKALLTDQCESAVEGEEKFVSVYNSMLKHVTKVRKMDKANKWRNHKYALNLVREAKGITAPTPTVNQKAKRRKPKTAEASSAKMAVLRVEEICGDSDDDTVMEQGDLKPEETVEEAEVSALLISIF